MSLLIQYLVKLSISLSIVWLFYQFVLRRLTFYNSNRWYLLGYSLLSFYIPFINISSVLENNQVARNEFVQFIPSVHHYTIALEEASHCPVPIWSTNYDKWDWMAFGLMIGAGIFLLRFIVRCLSFFSMRRKAKLISDKGMKLYHVDKTIIPFSFGNAVFINSNLHSETELEEIIRHEFVHVKQKHTFDIIWSEWLCIISWYNPFAWLLKRSIRQNLEFIADNKVLENGINKKQYQYLLLKVIGNNQFSIAQKFNFSSLKKRIAMMNKLKTAKLHLVKFLFVLPLLAVILISFRKEIGDSLNPQQQIIVDREVSDTIPVQTELNDKGYYIDIKFEKSEHIVVVKDKDRKEITRLPLTKWNQNKTYYENLYGEIPPPPPVLVPDAPMPPKIKNLPAHVNSINVNNGKATVQLRNGNKENYDLNVPKQKAEFENKYGQLPNPPNPLKPPTAVTPANPTNPPIPPIPPVPPVKIEKNELEPTIASVNDVNRPVLTNATGVLASAATINSRSPRAILSPATASSVNPAGATSVNVAPALYDKEYIITGKEDILITITSKTTLQQLEEYKKQMKEKGVELKFDVTEFENGVLKHIRGSMSYKDSKSVFSATDFRKLILAMIRDEDRIYFKVNSTDKNEVI